MQGYGRMSFSTQITAVVKRLIIANVLIWFVGQVLLETLIFKSTFFLDYFSLKPMQVLERGFIWQLATYSFLHSPTDLFHILFNMAMLWWFGSELESRWGGRFFLIYYMVCALGAGVIYVVGSYFGYLVFNTSITNLMIPVIGASGAIFGIFLAYGILFGDRVIYILGVFPMKAKIFVIILSAIQLVMLLQPGKLSGVAYLAHLGGVLTGYLFLIYWSRRQKSRRDPLGGNRKERRRNLRLVVNNEDSDDEAGPRYWN
jgi:membrane associated rhomboid family serine protease